MRKLMQSALIACLVIHYSCLAVGEVDKINFGTDATWKAIDFENQGWTSKDYDDSWWESAVVRDWYPGKLGGSLIWYPGTVTENIEYFRGSVDIPGSDIIYGILDVGIKNEGTIELYLNDNSIGTVKTDSNNPTRLYIMPYLKPGKNVIAAKVTVTPGSDYWGWGLDGLIRYNK